MIKKNWKILLLTSIVILLPILAGLILWNQLPEQIPIHWNASGEIDGWSSKPFAVFGLPLFFVGIHWLAVFATFTDPKKQNHSDKILHLILWLIPVLSIVLSVFTYSVAMGRNIRVEVLIPMLIGLLFVAIGNYLPKCQQNYTIGIKIPWTLSSEENWNRTHRLAGWVMVIGGIVFMVAGFFGVFWLVLPAAVTIVLVPIVYSYILHKKGV